MYGTDVKCPICGKINKNLYLEETDGWMECENCHNVVQVLAHSEESKILISKNEQFNVLLPIKRKM